MNFDTVTRRPGRATLLAATACLAAAGCKTDDLVAIQTPDVVPPGTTLSVAALPSVFNTAVAEFTVAYQGSNGGSAAGNNTYGAIEGQILYSGLMADEFLLSDTFNTRQQIDIRNIFRNNGNNSDNYRQLQIARVAAERSAAAYQSLISGVAPSALAASQASQAEAFALAGYTYLYFAENYCSGVPFSTLNEDGTVTNGPPRTTAEMLALASAKFDSAIAVATTAGNAAASQLRLARVGKARTLVDQGAYPAAGALVAEADIPTSFQYQTFANLNTTRQNNGIWSFNRSQRRWSVARNEGMNGLPFRVDRSTAGDATNDPRVLVARGSSTTTLNGFDGSPLYVTVKYSEQIAPSVVASGVEARLIQAEAALAAGNGAGMITILNALRSATSLYACPTGITLTNFTCPATQPTLPALTDPGDQTARVRLLFSERAFWLYGTSHRLGDLRRLARTAATGLSGYGLGVETVFPVGAYAPAAGATYGNQTSLPVPLSEENNPLYTAAACNNVAP